MKKHSFLFLLLACVSLSPIGLAFGDGASVFNSEGVKGKAYVKDDTKGGGYNGKCEGKKKNDPCTSAGSQIARCQEYTNKNKEVYLSCTVKACKEGFLLVLNADGGSRGICHSLEQAKKSCRDDFAKKGKTCPEGQEPVPSPRKNPNSSFSDDERAYNECFCEDKSNLKYDCGVGATGDAPVATKTYTNKDSITAPNFGQCSMPTSTFQGWKCTDENNKVTNVKANQKFNIEEKTLCVAQWLPCSACNPSNGCDCSLYVENNECKYRTSGQTGYTVKTGDGTAAPVCELSKTCPQGATGTPPNCKCPAGEDYDKINNVCEPKCNTEIATWDGSVCKCNENGKIYHADASDVSKSTCDCPPEKPVYENGQCVVPTKCPEGSTGTVPPDCECTEESKQYDSSKNECVPKCNTDIATWTDGECKCNEDGKIYHADASDVFKSTCDCPPEKPTYENGQCILPAACPEGATGTPPDCKCSDESKEYDKEDNICIEKCNSDVAVWKNGKCECKEKGKIYNPETATCDCPEDKPSFEGGQCVLPKKCPADATGTPPDCNCKDESKEYDASQNKCNAKCDTSVADWKDGRCVCKEEGYIYKNGTCIEDPKKRIKDKEKAYKDAKDKEQSKANRTLTALTTAATGIGGMELAMGLAQQSADKEAEQDMSAYIQTFRCTYGDGKQVKSGIEEIELPGGNDENLMKYRSEYLSLAADLKSRKEALGMKPGIESEEILDKSKMGLYDDENVGITGGSYASLYRAQALSSEEDQTKIDADKKAAKNRVIAGGVLVGAGVIGGMLGDSLINGKLGEKIKQKKKEKAEKNAKKAGVSTSALDKDVDIKKLDKDELIKLAKENGITLTEDDLD